MMYDNTPRRERAILHQALTKEYMEHPNIHDSIYAERMVYEELTRHPMYLELLKEGVYTKIIKQEDPVTYSYRYTVVASFTDAEFEQFEKNRMMDRLAGTV